eukprot:scaffold5675_cov151-Amphora_coffeaeformis.AAC.2
MRVIKMLWSHFPRAMSSEAVLKKVVEKRGCIRLRTLSSLRYLLAATMCLMATVTTLSTKSTNMYKVVGAGATESAKQTSLARFMQEIGLDILSKCVSADFRNDKSTLVILTGIQISMPSPFCDFFLPLKFFIMKKDGSKEDVFEEAFGPNNN